MTDQSFIRLLAAGQGLMVWAKPTAYVLYTAV